MTLENSLPQKGDNPFSINQTIMNSPTFCSLNFLAMFNPDNSAFAEAFKKAADKIVSELENNPDPEHPDPLLCPSLIYTDIA